MYFKKYFLLPVICTLFIPYAQMTYAASVHLHYTPPEPADIMKSQPQNYAHSSEAGTLQRLEQTLKLESTFKTTYEEKVNPVTNEVEKVREGVAVEW